MDTSNCFETNWETSKENVQPLRTGRSASFLNAALQPSEEHNKHLMEERQQFEEDILAGENSSDPISSWDKYLKWMQQNFPIGKNNKTVETILRRFIIKFLKCDKYKNDPRYINAWITMTRLTANPENIFSYMHSEGIGNRCSSFYVAWAEEWEKYNMLKKAAEIYQMGQDQNAEPMTLLIKMKNAFEMRSAREAIKSIECGSPVMENENRCERKPLQKMSGKKSLPFSNKNVQDKTGCSIIQNSGINFSIFSDENFSSKPDNKGKWADVPDHYKANKQNAVQTPSSWRGSFVQQRARTSQTPGSKFEIFEDSYSPSDLVAPPSTRKISQNVERLLAESKASSSAEQPLQQVLSKLDENDNSKTIRHFPMDKIYCVMGEFQLEEIIAAARRKNTRESQNDKPRLSTDSSNAKQPAIE